MCCPESEGSGPNFGTNYAADTIDKGRLIRPEERGCGLSTRQIGKITGGRRSEPGDWPWMVALVSNMANKAFCGGTLITDRHVLTAAHCLSMLKPREFRVRLGEYDFSRLNETRASDFTVLEMRLHIDFDPTK